MTSREMHGLERKKFSSVHLLYIVLGLGVVIVAYPLFWMVMSSFKTYNEIYRNVWGLPGHLLFSNYTEAWTRGISRYFFNSVLVTAATIVGVLLISSLCAYGLSRYSFALSSAVLLFCMGGMMLNPQVCLLYMLLQKMHLRNTYWALILPYIAFRLPLSILLIRTFFLAIPKEIEESARMDGCPEFTIYARIIMPMSRPILVTCMILTAYYAWNEFQFSVIFIDSEKFRTIPSGLMTFRDALATNWGVMLAGMVISAIPLIALFIALQKQFIRGMTAGSVKG